ncbi:MAG: polyprenyl synthetase family protein [Chloroflexota bacterium]
MALQQLTQTLLPAIEEELQRVVATCRQPGLEDMYAILAYHMGWQGQGAGPEARGKRIRPMLVLLTAQAAGGSWQTALPAAAAVELIHNFSLVHDDIQDQSPLRRGRPTVWTQWGVAQAINAGDALYTLAFLALRPLPQAISTERTLRACSVLAETCLLLTQGQYLDLAYEARGDLHVEAYWPMVSGKTSALLAACGALGALSAQAEEAVIDAYRRFGSLVGIAFQVLDDLLGIWGDAALTGKSAESDLLSGKKSLPVLYGLARNGPFAERWKQGGVTATEVSALAAQLEAEGGRAFTQDWARRYTGQALQALEEAQPQGEAGAALRELADLLLKRQA